MWWRFAKSHNRRYHGRPGGGRPWMTMRSTKPIAKLNCVGCPYTNPKKPASSPADGRGGASQQTCGRRIFSDQLHPSYARHRRGAPARRTGCLARVVTIPSVSILPRTEIADDDFGREKAPDRRHLRSAAQSRRRYILECQGHGPRVSEFRTAPLMGNRQDWPRRFLHDARRFI